MEPTQVYSVSDFQAVCNQILETAFSGVVVEGEVACKALRVSLLDDEGSCFD